MSSENEIKNKYPETSIRCRCSPIYPYFFEKFKEVDSKPKLVDCYVKFNDKMLLIWLEFGKRYEVKVNENELEINEY